MDAETATTTMAWCSAVEPAGAEALRRSLDGVGMLDVRCKATRGSDGRILLPLTMAGHTTEDEIQQLWAGTTPLSLVQVAKGQLRGARSALVSRGARALEDAGVAGALVQRVVDALPKRWEKLGDIVLLASAAEFDSVRSTDLNGVARHTTSSPCACFHPMPSKTRCVTLRRLLTACRPMSRTLCLRH